MSVLIKGVDMPKDCWDCRLVDIEYSFCHAKCVGGKWNEFMTGKERPEWCPLVEVPNPEEFERRMKDIESGGRYDIPEAHGYADDLMCETLEKLGYGAGVKIFNSLEKWYE